MALDCQWVRSSERASRSIREEDNKVCVAYILVTGVAMELLTNTIQVGAVATAMGALALILGCGWVSKLVVGGLDHPPDPLGSALVALFARDEGGPLLGHAPEEGLNTVLGEA